MAAPPPLPPWMRPPPRAAGRDDDVAALEALLAQAGAPCWAWGPPGSGLTSVGALVAARAAVPVVAARLTPCRTPADVLLVLGEATGAVPPGEAGAVGGALAALGPALVVLDDADLPDRGEVLDQLQALAPAARFLCLGRRAPPGAPGRGLLPIVGVAPAGLPEGLPLPPRAEALAILGVALPGPLALPEDLLVGCGPEGAPRHALRRSSAEALRARAALDPWRVATAVLPDLEPLLGLAAGAPLRRGTSSDDAFTLRWLGEVLPDPDASCRASAAAARLLAALGPPGPALEVLDAADRRNPNARPGARALVAWARGDLALAAGDLGPAEAAWTAATTLLARAREPQALAGVLRRQADALAARGRAGPAARRYRAARALYVQQEDEAGVAATVRGTADLAVATGEVLSAGMLYDEAGGTSAGAVEACSRLLGRAGLALAQGDLERARTLLDDAAFPAVAVPLLDACRERRRAELYLREGQHGPAEAAARRAAEAFARLGERVALGQALRLLGDVHAAAGRPTRAVRAWQEALDVQIRVRDLPGLRRTLLHALALEAECGDPRVAAELRRALWALDHGSDSAASASGAAEGSARPRPPRAEATGERTAEGPTGPAR